MLTANLGDAPCEPHARAARHLSPTCTWHPDHPRPADEPQLPAASVDLLDFDQARRLLGLARNTLYRLLRAGEVPGARRVGKLWRFHQPTLLHWIATGTGEPRRGRRR